MKFSLESDEQILWKAQPEMTNLETFALFLGFTGLLAGWTLDSSGLEVVAGAGGAMLVLTILFRIYISQTHFAITNKRVISKDLLGSKAASITPTLKFGSAQNALLGNSLKLDSVAFYFFSLGTSDLHEAERILREQIEFRAGKKSGY